VGMTNAQRGARWRQRQRELGLSSVCLVIPKHLAPDLVLLAEALRADPHLEPGPLRDRVSGRLLSARSVLARRASTAAAGPRVV
jgi:hypothetical protein